MSRIIGMIAVLAGFILLAWSIPDHWPAWGPKLEKASVDQRIEEIHMDSADVNVRIVAEDREDLAVALKGIGQVSLSVQETGIGITIRRQPLSWLPIDCTAVIYLPESYAGRLTIASDHGQVNLDGVSGEHKLGLERLEVRAHHGDMALMNVKLGELAFTTDKGNLLIRQSSMATGTIRMDTGKVELHEVDGSLQTELGTGVFEGEAVTANQSEVTVGKGEISLKQFSGDWNTSLSVGHITMAGGSEGKFGVTIDKGDANITDCIGDFQATITKGSIHADRMTASEGVIRAQDGEVYVEHYSGGLRTELHKGQVHVGVIAVTKPLVVKADSGDITISLPSSGDFTLEASADKGTVDSSLDLQGTEGAGTKRVFRWSAGQGTVPVRVSSGGGDIHIR